MNLLKTLTIGALLAILGSAPCASAIGRSGNGLIESDEMGFTAEAPTMYTTSQNMGQRNLRLVSPILGAGAGTGMRPQFLELRELPGEFPEFASCDRQGARALASQKGWQQETTQDPCIEAFSSHSSSTAMLVATWGKGLGVVLLAPQSPTARSAMNQILHSMRLMPGACGWN